MMRALTACLFSLICWATTSSAQDLSAADRTALQTRINAFEIAFEENDLDAVVGVVPPKVFAAMAAQYGLEPTELRAGIAQAMAQAMASVTVDSFEMRTAEAAQAVTPAGRPYLLVPTTTVMTVEGNSLQADNQTLAFADEGAWYLVRIDDAQQIEFLTLAYPEFEGVDFPQGTIKAIDN